MNEIKKNDQANELKNLSDRSQDKDKQDKFSKLYNKFIKAKKDKVLKFYNKMLKINYEDK